MILREEWSTNLCQWHGDRWNPAWRPKPGDFVCDNYDAKATFGFVIAVGVLKKGGSERALVLWQKMLSPSLRQARALTKNMARQIADHEDTEIMKILTEMEHQ